MTGSKVRRRALEDAWVTWRPMTTAQLLDAVAARHPDRDLVITPDERLTYADVAAWSRRIAAGLRTIGVGPGDHVAVDLCNGAEAVAMKFAVARLGAVSVSVNFLLRHEELGYILSQSRAKVLVTMDEFRGMDYLDALDRLGPGWDRPGTEVGIEALRQVFVHPTRSKQPARGRNLGELVDLGRGLGDAEITALTATVDPGAASDLLYTSGTTGKAKGALLQHDSVLRTAYASAYTRAFGDGYRIGTALPLYHVFGYIEALVAVLFAGGGVYLQSAFDADDLLGAVSRHRLDELMCVPAMTTVLLDQAGAKDYDLSALHTMFSSGAAHQPGMWDEMVEVLAPKQLFTAYGQTETTASTMCTQPGDPLRRLVETNGCAKPAGIAGDPALGGVLAVYKVVHTGTGEELPAGEVGELVVRGPIVTPGYYDKPAETEALFTADGWMRTGDLGRIDAHGYLSLSGRTKEAYRCGGELVMPSEVEEVLLDHAAVEAAYVVCVPHPRMGEVGCAWLVPAAGTVPDPAEIIAYCATRLARFKVPAMVLLTEEGAVPRTVTGRVRKFELSARAVAALEPAPAS